VLKALAEAGQLAPVIDRTFPLSEATDAISYLESGRHRGKVVISIHGVSRVVSGRVTVES
jgi:NADPH:quinone reductase-like Zn-dependent oxidoreductase